MTTAIDIVGGHNATIEGVVDVQVGQVGDKFVGDGATVLTVPKHADFDQGRFTIMGWVDTVSATLQTIIANWQDVDGVFSGFHVDVTATGNLDFHVAKNSGNVKGTDYENVESPLAISDGERTFVAVRYDGKTIDLFVDGSIVATAPWTSGVVYDAGCVPSILAIQSSTFTIPTAGLESQLDGSITTSFYTDSGKTTNAVEGGKFHTWEDQSGNNNDWKQTNATYQPTVSLASGHMINTESGESQADHLVGHNISGWTEGSFFTRIFVNSGSQGAPWSVNAVNTSINHYDYSGTHYMAFACARRSTTGAPMNQWVTLENNMSASGLLSVYINGTLKYSIQTTNSGFAAAPTLACGEDVGRQFGIGANFRKFAAYSRIVTANERIQINNWLES